MKKKTITKTKWMPQTEKDYWEHYQKLSWVYKAIELNRWKKHFQEVLVKDPDNSMAQNILKRCVEEEVILVQAKQEQDKKLDESLLVKEQYSSKRPKK